MTRRQVGGLWLAAGALLAAPTARPRGADTARVVVAPIVGEINHGQVAFLKRAAAQARGAKALVVRIDTFGGRVDAAVRLSAILSHLDGVRTLAFVDSKAWSAGAHLALSTQKIYMTPEASIGSAMPVTSSGGKTEPVGEKYVSALRTDFRALAERNGHPPDLAEAMVDRDVEVLWVEDGAGNPVLKRGPPGPGEVIRATVSGKGKLLNLTATQAAEYGLAAAPVKTLGEVLAAEGLDGAERVELSMSRKEAFVSLLVSTTMATLLTTLGFILITSEAYSPGFGALGLSGAACLGLVFWGHSLADFAEWTDALMFAAGFVLLALEIFLIPGFGLPGILGFSLILAAAYLTFVPFTVPSAPWEFDRLKEVLAILAASVAFALAMSVLLAWQALKRLFAFSRAVDGSALGASIPGFPGRRVGERGLALGDLAARGEAQFGVDVVVVEADAPGVAKGSALEIVGAAAGVLRVRAAQNRRKP